MAYDPRLVQMLKDALPLDVLYTEKRMMGGLCLFLNGNMIGGADRTKTGEGRFMFRVGKDFQVQALMRPGASAVILGGRRMGGMIFVDETHCSPPELREWVLMALNFVRTLPVK